MDSFLGSLAVADAYHDFDKHLVDSNLDILLEGLPSNNYLHITDDISKRIILLREKELKHFTLNTFSSEQLFSLLKDDKETFSIVNDALFGNKLIKYLGLTNDEEGVFYLLENIEFKCDSGNKQKEITASPGSTIILEDSFDSIIYYKRWDSNMRDINSCFYSNFNITLYFENSNPVMVFSNESITFKFTDPSIQNNKPSVSNVLKSTTTSKIEKQIAFQRKRSGDWLQVLSCVDIKRFEGLVYFCSNDRIPILYAITLGISTIYTNSGDYLAYKSPFQYKEIESNMSAEFERNVSVKHKVIQSINLFTYLSDRLLKKIIVIDEMSLSSAFRYLNLLNDFRHLINHREIFDKFRSEYNHEYTNNEKQIINNYVHWLDHNLHKYNSLDINSIIHFPYLLESYTDIKKKHLNLINLIRILWIGDITESKVLQTFVLKYIERFKETSSTPEYTETILNLAIEQFKLLTTGGGDGVEYKPIIKNVGETILDYLAHLLNFYCDSPNISKIEYEQNLSQANIDHIITDSSPLEFYLKLVERFVHKYKINVEAFSYLLKSIPSEYTPDSVSEIFKSLDP